jgi:uncharacterized RDD family membrane protein YckC
MGRAMPKISSLWVRLAVVISVLWICVAYVVAARSGQLTGPTLVQWCVAPVILAWGTAWIVSAFRAQRGVPDAGSATEPKATLDVRAANASAIDRYLARTFDLTLWSLVLGYPLAYLMGLCAPGSSAAVVAPTVATVFILITVFLVVLLPFVLWFDALVYRWFRNTPGKALLGLSVRTRTNERLSPAQYLNRNLAMWVPGLGLGLPPISMMAVGASGLSLTRTGATRWDAYWGYSVAGTRKQVWRVSAFIVLGLLMLTISRVEAQNSMKQVEQLVLAQVTGGNHLSANNAFTSQAIVAPAFQNPPTQLAAPQAESERSRFSQNLAWMNPVTGLPARLPDQWSQVVSDEANSMWSFVTLKPDGKSADSATLALYHRQQAQPLLDFVHQRFSKAKIPIEFKERMVGNRLVIYVTCDAVVQNGPFFTDSEFWESKEGIWSLTYGSSEEPNDFNIFEPREIADLLMASTTP